MKKLIALIAVACALNIASVGVLTKFSVSHAQEDEPKPKPKPKPKPESPGE